MKYAALFLTAGCLLSSVASASDNFHRKDHMDPFESELLSQTVTLSENCANISVVEWKATSGWENSTKYSLPAKRFINQICNTAVSKFASFITAYGFHLEETSVRVEISLLPADVNRGGENLRNLNDSTYRFARRYYEYDDNHQPLPIWGFYQRSRKHIYIRNDVLTDDGQYLNLRFRTVFAHELFHALSHQYGIYNQYTNDAQAADEHMARQFTKYLRYGE